MSYIEIPLLAHLAFGKDKGTACVSCSTWDRKWDT